MGEEGHTRAARWALAGLTKVQRGLVRDGCIHGDFSMVTVRALKRKGMFSLVISSPNGQCGFMELTPLGKDVQALIKARSAISRATGGEDGK